MLPIALVLYILSTCAALAASQAASSLASQYALTTSTSIPFPTATMASSDAQSFIESGWSLSKGHIQNGGDNLEFVKDPFPNNPAPGSAGNSSAAPVLQVTYPAGSFSHDTGGAQLYSLWNTSDGSSFNSMILSYEVAFDTNFDFVKGGKLPGLRGGPIVDSCSGGDAANGTNCFSSRVMWRTKAAGEVYAYIPTYNGFCSKSAFKCNQDGFGTSIDRGSFSFVPGQWNMVTMFVRLNNPGTTANGQVMLYYNNVKAINEGNLDYRKNDSVTVGGLYLSTFFGGDDNSWATPQTVHTYFRNFQMWGSSAASNATGQKINGAASTFGSVRSSWLLTLLASVSSIMLGGLVW